MYYVLFFLLQVVIFMTSAQENTDCLTPLDVRGTCVNILNCQSLLTLLQTNSDSSTIIYLQNSTCGFDGIYPLVCCPQDSQVPQIKIINPTDPPTTMAPVLTTTPKALYTLPKAPQCGISAGSSNRVVNGDPAKLGEFPWIAALGYRNPKNSNTPRWLAGGTLITDKHVLTAGHCVYNRPDLYLARLGELDLNSDYDGAQPVDVLIDKIKLHEGYDSNTITNDIAILTLANPVNGPLIHPICLPLEASLRSQTFVRYYPFVAGWGALYFEGPTSSHLQVVMLPVVSNEQCKQAFSNFKATVIDDRVLCAGYERGGKDACQGDSGGPLMLARGQDPYIFYQIGVVSFGFRCAEEGFPGVYTRTTAFLDWIERNLN